MDAGSTRIRLYSRLAAITLAALLMFGVSLLRVHHPEPHFGSLTITSYIITDPAPRPSPPPEPSARQIAATFLGEPSAQAHPRLWSYNSRGEIVFDHAEQYRRCVEARAARHNEADCPGPHDPHPLVLRPR